jgi:hypothetical protein
VSSRKERIVQSGRLQNHRSAANVRTGSRTDDPMPSKNFRCPLREQTIGLIQRSARNGLLLMLQPLALRLSPPSRLAAAYKGLHQCPIFVNLVACGETVIHCGESQVTETVYTRVRDQCRPHPGSKSSNQA